MKNRNFVSFFAGAGLLLTAMIWGFAFIVVKNSLDIVSPMLLLAFRFTIAAVLIGVIGAKQLRKINKKAIFAGGLVGVFLFFAYAFQTFGCLYTTAGKNAFLTSVYVIVVPFLNWAINKQLPRKKIIIAAFAAIVGIGFITLDGSSSLGINIGDMLTLICGVFLASQMVAVSRYISSVSPFIFTFIQLVFASVLSWVAALFLGERFTITAFYDISVVFSMIYLGVFSTMLCFFLQNLCQKYIPAAASSILLSTEAVFGCLFSFLFNNEQISLKMAIGCCIMFFSVLLVEIDFKPRKKVINYLEKSYKLSRKKL